MTIASSEDSSVILWSWSLVTGLGEQLLEVGPVDLGVVAFGSCSFPF